MRPVLVDQEIELGGVALVIKDLAVEQAGFEEYLPGIVFSGDGISQPENRQILAKVPQPVGNSLSADSQSVGSGNQPGRIFEGVKTVVKGQAVQDHFEGIGAVLADERSEPPVAVPAGIDLDRFVLLLPGSLLNDFGAMAIGTENHRLAVSEELGG